MTLGDAPVIWFSKLQTEISLSTMEAEYISLSTAMKAFIPLRRMLTDLLEVFKIKRKKKDTISTVWEDNAACLKLANLPMPRMTPRSKHIGVKYHWFRSREEILKGDVEILSIESKAQKADMFTKSLRRDLFEKMRFLVMGW